MACSLRAKFMNVPDVGLVRPGVNLAPATIRNVNRTSSGTRRENSIVQIERGAVVLEPCHTEL